jgi:hypothetical protein
MKFLQFSIAGAVALVFSGAALTQSPGVAGPATDPPSTLGALDTDRDGSISPAEAAQNPGLAGQFLSLDANFNGALEPAEFARFETLGADSTRGTPGAPGSPGSPAPRDTITPPPPLTGGPPPLAPPPVTQPPAGTTAPGAAPDATTPPPGSGTPPG